MFLNTHLDCQALMVKSDPGGSCRPLQLQNTDNNSKSVQAFYLRRSIVILPNFGRKGTFVQPLLWNVNTAGQGVRLIS